MTAASASLSLHNIDTKKGQKFWLLGDVYTFHITCLDNVVFDLFSLSIFCATVDG
jgi:hypothetical protein